MGASIFKPLGFTALAVCTALGLSGCKWALNVGVTGDLRAPVFNITSGAPLRRETCIDRFRVYPEASPGEGTWDIASEQLKCVEATKITYGVTPAEFRTVRPPDPLMPSTVYVAYASGDGWVGQIRFVYRDGGFHTL